MNKDGYSETQAIKNNRTLSTSSYPAFYYALNYGTSNESETTAYTAPKGSSGWFLPSVGQWWDILTNLGQMPTKVTGGGIGWCHWDKGDDTTGKDTNDYPFVCALNINNYLTSISTYSSKHSYRYGTPISFSDNSEYYWSSSGYNKDCSFATGFNHNGPMSLSGDYGKSTGSRVRPVLAF